MTKDKKQLTEMAPYLSLLAQIGLIMISSILIGFSLGFFMGRAFGIAKIGLLLGTLTGVFAGFWVVYKLCLKTM